jgi:hypothetical protein
LESIRGGEIYQLYPNNFFAKKKGSSVSEQLHRLAKNAHQCFAEGILTALDARESHRLSGGILARAPSSD